VRHEGRPPVGLARGSRPDFRSVLTLPLWSVAAVPLLNTLGDVRGRSPVERWGPTVPALQAVLCAVMGAY
jgi:hypothetical protein